ncbi:MAG: MaoC family dehydratase [Pseudomonadota bacterium]
MRIVEPDEVASWVGKETGVSDWVLIDQERINQFAEVTEDRQFIHIDVEAAKATPFGGTIAHGFLTLGMLSHLAESCLLGVQGVSMAVNYGFEKVRFMTPVRSGQRIRGRFTLVEANERRPGMWMFKYAARIEIEDSPKPALVAEWMFALFS